MSDIDYNKPPYGYALRRKGSCISDEKDCGPTWGRFHVCCPRGTKCPSSENGSVCCKSESDCSPLMTEPHCADEYGVLYLSDKYFCCSNQTIAFKRTDGTNAKGWVGCAFDVEDAGANTQLLLANDTVTSASSTPFSTPHATLYPSSSTSIKTTTATTPTVLLPTSPTNNPSNEKDASSSSKTGIVAGGVVGGVAGFAMLGVIIWFLIRRRNEKHQEPPFRNSPELSTSAAQFGEYSATAQAGELDNSKDYVAELPGQRSCGY